LSRAIGHTYLVGLVLIILCLVPALFLPRKKIDRASDEQAETAVPMAVH